MATAKTTRKAAPKTTGKATAKTATGKTTTKETAVPMFEWPTPAKQLLGEYLKARVSGAADAPNQGLPFITEKGILRVKPSDWIEWLETAGIDVPKKAALQALKDAGLVQRVYPLPNEKRSFGLYTGPAPAETSKLARRVAERKAPAPAEPTGDDTPTGDETPATA